jgi:hypothetical protein
LAFGDTAISKKEIEMLIHLPIVVLTTLSPIAVSDPVPRFDIAKECRFESESSAAFERCSQDETDARQKLETEWPEFIGAHRSSCMAEVTIGGSASYVELLICLEMARDVDKEDSNVREPAKADSTPSATPETGMVDKRK